MDNLNELQKIANPYACGQPTDADSSTDVKRPVGTIILAVLLLLTGLGVGGQRCYLLVSAFSSGENFVVHPSFYVALTRDAISTATAVFGAIGLLIGRNFGWWLSTFHAYWRLAIQSVLPLLGVAAAPPGTASQSNTVSTALSSGLIFVLIAAYLQKKNVVSYFRVPARRFFVNLALFVACACIGFGLDVWWAMTQR